MDEKGSSLKSNKGAAGINLAWHRDALGAVQRAGDCPDRTQVDNALKNGGMKDDR